MSYGELKTGSHLFGRAARRCEPSARGPRIISIGFGDVENDAVHRAMHLVEERPIPLPDNRKHLSQASRRLKRPLLNDESHE